MVVVSREAVLELRAKYGEILEMRLSHRAGDEDEQAVVARMARLAARFPGALREIDDLALEEIRRRVQRLDAVLEGKVEADRWIAATAMFHALARGALSAKRWLAGKKRVDGALHRAFLAALPSLSFSSDAEVWSADLQRLAKPPGGRVTNVVFARIAQALGTSSREARELVFGPSRKDRPRPRPDDDPPP